MPRSSNFFSRCVKKYFSKILQFIITSQKYYAIIVIYGKVNKISSYIKTACNFSGTRDTPIFCAQINQK